MMAAQRSYQGSTEAIADSERETGQWCCWRPVPGGRDESRYESVVYHVICGYDISLIGCYTNLYI